MRHSSGNDRTSQSVSVPSESIRVPKGRRKGYSGPEFSRVEYPARAFGVTTIEHCEGDSMRTRRNWLMVIGLLVLFSTIAASQSQTSDRVELYRHPGLLWLSWSATERENFVYGYIQGYGHGMNEACLAADDLFEKDKTHQFGQEDVSSTFPSARCRASVAQYSNVKIDLSKGPDFSAYTTVITEFYTKHREYQDTPFTILMESLADTKGLTADDIYRSWTTRKSTLPK